MDSKLYLHPLYIQNTGDGYVGNVSVSTYITVGMDDNDLLDLGARLLPSRTVPTYSAHCTRTHHNDIYIMAWRFDDNGEVYAGTDVKIEETVAAIGIDELQFTVAHDECNDFRNYIGPHIISNSSRTSAHRNRPQFTPNSNFGKLQEDFIDIFMYGRVTPNSIDTIKALIAGGALDNPSEKLYMYFTRIFRANSLDIAGMYKSGILTALFGNDASKFLDCGSPWTMEFHRYTGRLSMLPLSLLDALIDKLPPCKVRTIAQIIVEINSVDMFVPANIDAVYAKFKNNVSALALAVLCWMSNRGIGTHLFTIALTIDTLEELEFADYTNDLLAKYLNNGCML